MADFISVPVNVVAIDDSGGSRRTVNLFVTPNNIRSGFVTIDVDEADVDGLVKGAATLLLQQ